MDAHTRKLVNALKKKRVSDGLSIRALSAKIGVSFSALARIERGEGAPDNNSRIRILNWLGEEAQEYGLSYRDEALVHFRAAKNVSSKTVHCLLQAADAIKQKASANREVGAEIVREVEHHGAPSISLSKTEMESMANKLRSELKLARDEPLDALNMRVHGVNVLTPKEVEGITKPCLSHLTGSGKSEWSAMSVPIDINNSIWIVLKNDTHPVERQRVTYLEECWHILLGHKLTRIAKVADSYGRTYDSSEEHDAFYLAAATLLPKVAIDQAVKERRPVKNIASRFGVSVDLVEYRIKRLGLWKMHRGITVEMSDRIQNK